MIANFVDGLVIGRMMPQMYMAAFGVAFPIFSIAGVFIGLFCKGHGLDKKVGNRASVCFEEMADDVRYVYSFRTNTIFMDFLLP